MEFVNQTYAQLAELLRSMSAGTRLATGLLLVIVVVSLVYLFQYQVAGGDEFLLGGRSFTASEVTAIEAAFSKAGLGRSQVVGNQIRIPRGQKAVYLAALADGNALPADYYTYLDEATAADSPFVSSRSLELRRWQAKQKTLGMIIGHMTGIDSATVQFDEEVKQGLTRARQKTAMVAVRTKGGRLDEEQVKAIRNVVQSAYAGLEKHKITITDLTNNISYGGSLGPDGQPEEESLYAMHKQRHERDWQRKIEKVLEFVPGVVVGINVDLNPDLQNNTQSVKLDNTKPFALNSSDYQKDQTSQSPHVAGRPGAVPNGVAGPQGNSPDSIRQSAAAGAESQSNESRSESTNVPSHETVVRTTAPLTPRKVTASIWVPASYYARIWKERNPPADGQAAKPPDPAEIAKIEVEMEKRIKDAVRNLLPDVDAATNPWPYIVVNSFTDLLEAPAAPPTLAATSGAWLAENWQTLAVVGVGLISLLMLRGMIRAPAVAVAAGALPAASQSAQPRLAVHEPPADEEEPEPAKALRARFRSSGPDLKAELQEIVKENPDAAATILRAWIGEAA